jgi:hypothetical protein
MLPDHEYPIPQREPAIANYPDQRWGAKRVISSKADADDATLIERVEFAAA